jgi:IS30 family transposase
LNEKSGYALIAKVDRKTAELVRQAIINKLEPLACMVKMITFDNGKEFADHALIDQALNSTSYFAQPVVVNKDDRSFMRPALN